MAAARLPALRPAFTAGRPGILAAGLGAGRRAAVARAALPHARCFSDAIDEKYKSEIFDLTNFYMEAKDALEDANESWETTYFDEDFGTRSDSPLGLSALLWTFWRADAWSHPGSAEAAKEAVEDMKSSYETLREKCSEDELPDLQKIVGLKLEEVKQAFGQLEDMAIEDE